MRKLLIMALAAIMVAAFSSVAAAEGDPALTYTSEDNVARAWFQEENSSMSVLVDETVRPDPVYSTLWVRAFVSRYEEPYVFCNGVVDRSGVNDYYFRNRGAFVDATIPFYCTDGSGPFDVHVVAYWDADGPSNINASTTSEVDDMGLRYVQTVKYSTPEVAGASLEMDFEPFPVPGFSYGELSMRTLHAVYPQPGDLP